MKEWEERALIREQEDPRRRASVMDRLVKGLADQLPGVFAAAALLFLTVGLWHLMHLRAGPDQGVLAAVSLLAGVGCGIGAVRTRGGTIAPERAHIALFGTTLVAATVAFAHLVVTRDASHSFAFMIILLASGAFYQDGLRLAIASSALVVIWIAGVLLAAPAPGVMAPAAMGMISAVFLTAVIGSQRIRALRGLQALNLELQEQIGFDSLTGIANRRAFRERLDQYWERLSNEDEPLALIMIDLDQFKNLNDTRGHGEGDAALRQMGGVLRMGVRSTEDLPARLGGEEFAVLLPRTKAEHAVLVAERIRDAVQYTHIPNPGTGGEEILTASLGVAILWPRDGGTPSELLDQADRALYEAKNGGRNRVILFNPRTQPPERAPYQAYFDRLIPGLEPAAEERHSDAGDRSIELPPPVSRR